MFKKNLIITLFAMLGLWSCTPAFDGITWNMKLKPSMEMMLRIDQIDISEAPVDDWLDYCAGEDWAMDLVQEAYDNIWNALLDYSGPWDFESLASLQEYVMDYIYDKAATDHVQWELNSYIQWGTELFAWLCRKYDNSQEITLDQPFYETKIGNNEIWVTYFPQLNTYYKLTSTDEQLMYSLEEYIPSNRK